MPYLETYSAYVRNGHGQPDKEWRGLTRGQAKWRYHWVQRNYWNLFRDYREYGWRREWQD